MCHGEGLEFPKAKLDQPAEVEMSAACSCGRVTSRRFRSHVAGPHVRPTLPLMHQVWCLGTGEGPDVLRKKVEQDSACGVSAACGCYRPFWGMRGGASCALHLAVTASGVLYGDWRRP